MKQMITQTNLNLVRQAHEYDAFARICKDWPALKQEFGPDVLWLINTRVRPSEDEAARRPFAGGAGTNEKRARARSLVARWFARAIHAQGD